MGDFDTLASEVIADLTPTFSKSMTFVSVTQGVYNPQTGDKTADSEPPTSIYGDIIQFTDMEKMIKGTKESLNVRYGDFKVVIYYSSDVDLNDKLRIDSVDYQIVQVLDKHYATDTFQSQVLHVRR